MTWQVFDDNHLVSLTNAIFNGYSETFSLELEVLKDLMLHIIISGTACVKETLNHTLIADADGLLQMV